MERSGVVCLSGCVLHGVAVSDQDSKLKVRTKKAPDMDDHKKSTTTDDLINMLLSEGLG